MFKAQCVVILSLVAAVRCYIEGYIVGGEVANIKNFPYCGYLNIICNALAQSWYCGSSILNQNIVLTAAHCLMIDGCGEDPIINLSTGNSYKNKGYMSRGKPYYIHERYDKRTMENDIALVRLRNNVPFSDRVNRVALMTNPPPVDQSEIAGWGLVDVAKMTGTQQLKHLKQTVWNRKACEKIIGPISAGQLCGSFGENEFPTVGDSGSALVVKGYIQIGIVSYKRPNLSNTLIVYTNVSYYVDWIQKQSKSLYCNNK